MARACRLHAARMQRTAVVRCMTMPIKSDNLSCLTSYRSIEETSTQQSSSRCQPRRNATSVNPTKKTPCPVAGRGG